MLFILCTYFYLYICMCNYICINSRCFSANVLYTYTVYLQRKCEVFILQDIESINHQFDNLNILVTKHDRIWNLV